jgi:hypothetical protein
MILMASSHIYFFIFKTCPCAIHIYYIGPTPKSVEYQFFWQFQKFLELPRQFSPMGQTCPGLGFQPIYIRGLSTPLNPHLEKPLSSLSLAATKTLPR